MHEGWTKDLIFTTDYRRKALFTLFNKRFCEGIVFAPPAQPQLCGALCFPLLTLWSRPGGLWLQPAVGVGKRRRIGSDGKSSCIPHPSSYIPHPSSYIPHPTSCTPHPASLIPHPTASPAAKRCTSRRRGGDEEEEKHLKALTTPHPDGQGPSTLSLLASAQGWILWLPRPISQECR